MTINLEDIRVGDRVTLKEGVVTGVNNGCVSFEIESSGIVSRITVHACHVATHNPAPREFKIGDVVTWMDGVRSGEIKAIDNCIAFIKIIRNASNVTCQTHDLVHVGNLRHADPAPAPQDAVKERKKIGRWINFYPDGHASTFYTRETADIIAGVSRIACLHVEGYEGDGL